MLAFPRPYQVGVRPSYQEASAALRDHRWERHPLGNGLYGFWPLVEGGGNTLLDITASHYGTNVNNPTWNGGILSYTQANSNYTSLGTLSAFANPPWSVACFVQWSTTNITYFLGSGHIDSGLAFYAQNNIILAINNNSTQTQLMFGPTLSENTWYQLVLTYDGATASLYVNKGNPTTKTVSTSFSPTSAYIARADTAYSTLSLQYLGIWSRILSKSEVAWLYAEPWAIFKPPTPLWIGYAPPSGSTTNITLSDSGVGSDQVALFASFSPTDSGTGVDSLSLSASLSLADSGTGTDTVLLDIVLADSGSGSDGITTQASLSLSDSGAGTDTIAEAAFYTLADSGNGTDGVTVSQLATTLTLSDTGSGTDTVGLSATLNPMADSGTGNDQTSLLASLATSDSGAASDLLAFLDVLMGDSGAGSDTIPLLGLVLGESGTGTDIPGLLASLGLSDAGAEGEILISGAATQVLLIDSGQGADRLVWGGPAPRAPQMRSGVRFNTFSDGDQATLQVKTGTRKLGGVQ